MKINCHDGWFKGLGDIVCYAWIGAAYVAQRKDIQFYATGWRADLLKMFQMPIVTDDESDSIVAHIGYEEAIKTNSPLNYLEWIAEEHGARNGAPCGIRPRANIMPMDRETGRMATAEVLIFPEGVWETRVWPKAYYVELVDRLHRAGVNVRVVTQQRDYAYQFVQTIYGKNLQFVSAAIQKARLVIGNDSGPAHLAGTLGTPTLAIHGPTRERIYAHIPEVTSLRKISLGCGGCHCLRSETNPALGWRRACEFGCAELYRTLPEDVFEIAMQMLGRETKEMAA